MGTAKGSPDDFLVAFAYAGHQHLENTRLPERYPKPVEVADDALSHSVKSVMRAFHDLHSILNTLVKIVDVVRIDIQINFPPVARTCLPALVEHNFTTSERYNAK